MIVTASMLAEGAARAHEEDDLQRSAVQYLRFALPADAEYFHIPNGGQRHKRAAARLVGLGVRAGMPDLGLVWRGRALFIELKTRTGTASPTQLQMHRKLAYCGVPVTVSRSVPEIEAWLRLQGMPLRAGCT
jgi:hypothetical protein